MKTQESTTAKGALASLMCAGNKLMRRSAMKGSVNSTTFVVKDIDSTLLLIHSHYTHTILQYSLIVFILSKVVLAFTLLNSHYSIRLCP